MENYLILSAHDYRSPRQANIHFITEELEKRGKTRFFSLKYSALSRYTSDWRLSLDDQANEVVTHKGVECYLWKTLIHPFNVRRPWLYTIESLLHNWYARGVNNVLRQWIKEATVIVLESGVAPIFFDLIKRTNPQATILYRASDALDTIGVASYVKKTFGRVAKDINAITLPSRALAPSIPSQHNLAYIPHGIDHALLTANQPSPFKGGINAVSVGSMLFDPTFFIIAAKHFPQITFHIIGSGHPRHAEYAENIIVYGETPFAETISFIRHAQIGIAPYASNDLPIYLKDTSMKLIQYDFFGVPAVCPEFVAGDYPSRYGYKIGDKESICDALKAALSAQRPMTTQRHLSWSDVTDRLLSPKNFSDTSMVPT